MIIVREARERGYGGGLETQAGRRGRNGQPERRGYGGGWELKIGRKGERDGELNDEEQGMETGIATNKG